MTSSSVHIGLDCLKLAAIIGLNPGKWAHLPCLKRGFLPEEMFLHLAVNDFGDGLLPIPHDLFRFFSRGK